MSSKVVERFTGVLATFFPVLEPLTPRYVSFYVRRRLRRLKNRGLLINYRTRTKRIGKLHYKIEVELDLTPEQASRLVRRTFTKLFRRR
jgi:transcription initiation factor IIE alpha subunit